MTEIREERDQLLEALTQGPNPSSPQEIAGASIDLFSALYGESVSITEYAKLNKMMGYVGALALLTTLTPNSSMDRDSRLDVMKESAGFLDRIPGRDGKAYVLKVMRSTEGFMFREQTSGVSDERRRDIVDLYLTARNKIPKKSRVQTLTEGFNLLVSSRAVNEDVVLLMGFARQNQQMQVSQGARPGLSSWA